MHIQKYSTTSKLSLCSPIAWQPLTYFMVLVILITTIPSTIWLTYSIVWVIWFLPWNWWDCWNSQWNCRDIRNIWVVLVCLWIYFIGLVGITKQGGCIKNGRLSIRNIVNARKCLWWWWWIWDFRSRVRVRWGELEGRRMKWEII